MGDTLNATPLAPDAVYANIGQLARWLHPDATRVRLVIEHSQGRTVIDCPISRPVSELSDHARRILEFLESFNHDGFIKRSIAVSIFEGELDIDGTPFKQALQELTAAGLIESKSGSGGGIRRTVNLV